MEYFSTLLKSYVKDNRFTYPPGCKDINMVNLSFTDDLFILCGASVNSMNIIPEVLNFFGAQSTLKPNLSKSTCYFAGISDGEGQLSAHDYRVLVDKDKKKIDEWGNQQLSFTGRLVMLNSELFGVCNYWCQTIFISKGTIMETERLMKKFLWKGVSAGKFLPKVSWKKATLRQEEGGLGIKSLHLWNSCIGKEALWIWKGLLHLTELLKPHVKYHNGNGRSVSRLYNNWSENGVMVEMLSARTISALQLLNTDSVVGFMDRVKWPRGRKFT
ncbi:hypothetical protein LIER_24952 [Lithospermum erythrorhizon]|uniref:Uncharacterized protein n=1 Tax=Lithospermum erythrorhizon TaxID=34254 RepID=A0AAV3R4F2_LITER